MKNSMILAAFAAIAFTSLVFSGCVSENANQGAPEIVGETFQFSSSVPICNEIYKLAIEEVKSNIRDNGSGGKYFVAGEGYDQLWTRDASYSIKLALGLLYPEISKSTLEYCTEVPDGKRIALQDSCGHFGGWPYLTDAIVWATGAWEFYKIANDRDFLAYSYDVIKNSLAHAENDAFDSQDGLFKGCSSFMESNSAYPIDYAFNGQKVGAAKVLSTNALYYNAYKIANLMGQSLGAPVEETDALAEKAEKLSLAINENLWIEESGFYAYYKDENGALSDRMEGLGEALVVLFGIADEERAAKVLESTYVSDYGIPCLWPQFTEWILFEYDPFDETVGYDMARYNDPDYYHNGQIWPFVMGYWALGAAKYDRVDLFAHELDALSELTKSGGTFMEFYITNGGKVDGSRTQLWSEAGYLAMIYQGIFGMNFEEEGISFDLCVPSEFKGETRLSNIPYRNAILNITIHDSGLNIAKFAIDGKEQNEKSISGDISGTHSIEIWMN
ncbi:MAG: glycoside hydrolase 100 family protein [Candidatus Thermoplasmatota archaeon]|nr:glycoside hydrolase 100 family protein [Candidatus Thermoplasmatota archaeon]